MSNRQGGSVKEPKLVTIEEFVKINKGNVAEAARVLDVDYIQFRRWLKRINYAPEHASTRREMARQGVDLPRRTDGRTR